MEQHLIELEETLNYYIPDFNNTKILDEIKNGLTDSISLGDLYDFISFTCIAFIGIEPDIDKVASFYLLKKMYLTIDKQNYLNVLNTLINENCVSDSFIKYCKENIEFINNLLNFENVSLLNFFGLITLEKLYLLKNTQKQILEAPQHLFLRISIQLCIQDTINQNKNITETYYYISNLYYTHATPTCTNSGTKTPQLSSCFLMQCGDSIEDITKAWSDIAKISKFGGGIGINICDIRAEHSIIKSNGGKSSGILPLCKVFESIAQYVNQRGVRKGSVAIYIEPWHSDILTFLNFQTIAGNEKEKTRDLYLGLWIPDLFMKYVENDLEWYLMSPDTCTGLTDVYGEDFETLYNYYVSKGLYTKKIKATVIFDLILKAQIETGMPYMMYKDSVNKKSNQMNLGTIKNSNLCVAPETRILTDRGNEIIKTLANQRVNIWNGKTFSSVIIKKTGDNQKLIKINFSNNSFIECTEYHKFFIENENNEIDIIEAQYLRQNMKIKDFNIPLYGLQQNIYITSIENNNRFDETYCFNEPNEHSGVFNGILTMNCTEIVEYSSSEEIAVCNLASISLPRFVNNGVFNFELLSHVTQLAIKNLNAVIDINFYPVPEAQLSNFRHRPVALGVSGLSDTYMLMDLNYDSQEAHNLNKKIFECIYYNSLKKSNELAKQFGAYSSFKNSPLSKGLLQFNLWGKNSNEFYIPNYPSFDWDTLTQDIITFGTRNSLLTSIMPTSSVSLILSQCEACEPYSSNLYKRITGTREFVIINKHLVKELKNLNLWNEKLYHELLYNEGSVQNLNVPQNIKLKYKTAFELKQISIVTQSYERAIFIDQTQSLNIFMDFSENSGGNIEERLKKCHFKGWKLGLKTGMYYLRSKPKNNAIKFGVDPNLQKEFKEKINKKNEDICLSCVA